MGSGVALGLTVVDVVSRMISGEQVAFGLTVVDVCGVMPPSIHQVNRIFRDTVLEVCQLKENDVLWVHDYHLMLLPAMVRAPHTPPAIAE